MVISMIRIRRLENTGNKMIGVCSLTLDGLIVIHDIKILQNDGKKFLAMPSRKTNSGTFKDIVHPISVESRGKIEELIFSLYEVMCTRGIANQEFQYADLDCNSLLCQTSDRFEVFDYIPHSAFDNDNIRKEIASWISELKAGG